MGTGISLCLIHGVRRPLGAFLLPTESALPADTASQMPGCADTFPAVTHLQARLAGMSHGVSRGEGRRSLVMLHAVLMGPVHGRCGDRGPALRAASGARAGVTELRVAEPRLPPQAACGPCRWQRGAASARP